MRKIRGEGRRRSQQRNETAQTFLTSISNAIYRAHKYFYWLDDILDAELGSESKQRAFLNRQKSLLES